MSGKLNPSRSTVYVSNLPFSLTNNDLHKLFVEYGTVVKVTVLKEKDTRRSKGVGFVLFLKREDAQKCANDVNGKVIYGRTLKASIAKDNGRSAEFIRKRTYGDKSFCYECGEEGHLSYKCPKNFLGERKPPPKKIRKKSTNKDTDFDDSDPPSPEQVFEPDLETLSAAIEMEQKKYLDSLGAKNDNQVKRKKIKQSSYFSDEEDISD